MVKYYKNLKFLNHVSNETYINEKKEGLNMMKGFKKFNNKFLSFFEIFNFKKITTFFMLLFLMFNANAVVFSDDQDVLTSDLEDIFLTSQIYPDALVSGDVATNNGAFNLYFSETPIYVLVSSPNNNASFQFVYDVVDSVPITKNYVLNANELLYLRLTPNQLNENVYIQTFAGGNGTTINYVIASVNDDTRTLPSVMATFIGYSGDLLKVNLNLWKLGYYVIIGGIIVSVVFGFILIGRRIYEASKNSPQFQFGKRRH